MTKRRMIGLVTATVLLGAGIWFFAGWSDAQRACAHDPRFTCSPRSIERAITISDPTKSWAYYGQLGPDQSDAYAFSTKTTIHIPWQILIEQTDIKNTSRPHADLRDSQGKLVASIDLRTDPTQTFFEPFSRISYLATKPKELTLMPGQYMIKLFMTQSVAPQRYVMAIGEDERFGLGEIPYVFGAIHRVQSRGY